MKPSRHRKDGDELRAGCPAWMMTFGDCMSLLVTFFVMLIAFSNMEEDKLSDMLGAMRGAFGVVDRLGVSDVQSESPSEVIVAVEGDDPQLRFLTADEISDIIPRFVDEMRRDERRRETVMPDYILLQMLDEGLAIVLLTREVFDNGTAKWRENLDRLWIGIGRLLEGRANEMRITAVLSPSSFVDPDVARSVWGLGVLRAETTACAMQTQMGAAPDRFGVGVRMRDDQMHDDDLLEIMIMAHDEVLDVGLESAWSVGGR